MDKSGPNGEAENEKNTGPFYDAASNKWWEESAEPQEPEDSDYVEAKNSDSDSMLPAFADSDEDNLSNIDHFDRGEFVHQPDLKGLRRPEETIWKKKKRGRDYVRRKNQSVSG